MSLCLARLKKMKEDSVAEAESQAEIGGILKYLGARSRGVLQTVVRIWTYFKCNQVSLESDFIFKLFSF